MDFLIEATVLLIILTAAKYIGNEHALKVTSLKKLSELNPVTHRVEFVRAVLRVSPQSWTLVTRAYIK